MKKRINIDLTVEQHAELKACCAKRGMSLREYIITLINKDWVDKGLPHDIWLKQ